MDFVKYTIPTGCSINSLLFKKKKKKKQHILVWRKTVLFWKGHVESFKSLV